MRARVSRAVVPAVVLMVTSVVGCGADQDPFVLPEDQAELRYEGGPA